MDVNGNELRTESDVEHKVVWPLLTSPHPTGLNFSSADILTKRSTRRLEIGKGGTRKLYYPDYLIVLGGLPLLVVEAKAPGEDLHEALREARLYGAEINALFETGTNPVSRTIVCDGRRLLSSPIDSADPDFDLPLDAATVATQQFAEFVEICRRPVLQQRADGMRAKLRRPLYRRPVSLVGGATFQNEELAQNTFGATIVGDYGHIFNPRTLADRERIVRGAYIASLKQQRYVEPIDRLIRNAVAPAAASLPVIENSRQPKEISKVLESDRRKLENQIMLLIGSVGAGKSTFVDYLSMTALPEAVRERTVWVRLNLNDAPLDVARAYEWVAHGMLEELRNSFSDVDYDELKNLETLFAPELRRLRKGALAVLDAKSVEYKVRLADYIRELQSNDLGMAKAIARHECGSRRLLLVVVLDNCDKRTRDEQLAMFQIAHWLQNEFRCFIILPLRDVTYDLHRHDPPLDTALKQFVFRIEPPSFSDVLQARVRLALEEIAQTAQTATNLSYLLPNGIRVSYPAQDQALYLASILRSLYAHDRFVRQVMTGLAGRDVRKALEIFLEFCISGHIGEDEIYKIRFFEGQHILPISVVARVLLRMRRRFYDGNASYLKNIVQCAPEDALPDHFVRINVLRWFEQRLREKGPAGVEGFHRAADMLTDLSAAGHDSDRVSIELGYLVREGLLIPEHLRDELASAADLVKISSSGVVHLQLMVNPEYLAACAEDSWIGDAGLSERVAARIGRSIDAHFSALTTASNAEEFVAYLEEETSRLDTVARGFLDPTTAHVLESLRGTRGLVAAEVALPDRLFVGGLPHKVQADELRRAFRDSGVALRELALPLDQSTGLNRGFAFITPEDRRALLRAIDLDGIIALRGRRLRISEAHRLEEEHVKEGGSVRSAPPLSKRFYLAKLPFEYSVANVRALLATFDITATDIYLIRDRATDDFRGACFVEVHSLDEAARAIGAINGFEFQGRRLIARPADPRD